VDFGFVSRKLLTGGYHGRDLTASSGEIWDDKAKTAVDHGFSVTYGIKSPAAKKPSTHPSLWQDRRRLDGDGSNAPEGEGA
jgi:hypothetical protein